MEVGVAVAWDPELFRRARLSRYQTQGECAAELRRDYGINCDQPSVSAWENGRLPRGATQAKLNRYIANSGLDDSGNDLRRAVASDEPAYEAVNPDRYSKRFVSTEELLRDPLTGEPMLGPRQGALIDALIQRLSAGPGLTESDQRSQELLMSVLGISAEPR